MPQNYIINMLWLNESLNQEQQYLMPEFKSRSPQSYCQEVINWSRKNPDAQVNLWYDPKTTPTEAIENTKSLLSEMLGITSLEHSKISLKSIDEIEFVAQNQGLIGEHMPLYYRIDFLKLILCLHTIASSECAIFADFNLDPIGPDFLFNTENLKRLNAWGLLNGAGEGCIGQENKFLIMINKPEMRDALRHMVNWCLFQVEFFINAYTKRFPNDTNEPATLYRIPLNVTLYQLHMYYACKNFGSIRITKDPLTKSELDEEYHPDRHGYLALGNFSFNYGTGDPSLVEFHGETISLSPRRDYLKFLDNNQCRISTNTIVDCESLVGYPKTIYYSSQGLYHTDNVDKFLSFVDALGSGTVEAKFWKPTETPTVPPKLYESPQGRPHVKRPGGI